MSNDAKDGKHGKQRDEDARAKARRDAELKDLREVLRTDAGKRVINRIFQIAHMFSVSFTGNSTTFFNEGTRWLGLWLCDECQQADPEALKEAFFMHKESNE